MEPREEYGQLEDLLTRRDVLVRGAGVLGGIGLLPLLAACGGDGGESSGTTATFASVSKGGGKEVDSITWAIPSDIASFDYAFAYDFSTNVPVTNVTESLLRFSADGKMHPNLAESWDQPDATTYVYHLREGVKFHDGSEMTAEDVAYSMNRILDPKVASPLSFFTSNVKSIEATGPYEVTAKLTKPDAMWLYGAAITTGSVSKKAFLESQGKNVGTPQVGIIGTGPYKFSSWTRGQEIVIDRFDDYWNKERLPKVKRVVVKVLADESTTISSLGTGDVDGTFGLSGKGVKALAGSSDVGVIRAPSFFIHFLGINTQRKPWNDARVRQAISYAIDKQGTLESVWAGYGSLSKSVVTPAEWSFERETFKTAYDQLPAFEHDVDKAKQLIEQAGAKGASAEILVATSWQEELGLATQAAGKEIGLDFKLKKIPLQQLYAAILDAKGKDYDMFIVDWASDVPDATETLQNFHSTNKVTNEAAYANPKVDALLDEQNQSTDPAERARLLTEAQAMIVADQAWIVYYSPEVLMPLNKRIGGYPLSSMWFWSSWAADMSGV